MYSWVRAISASCHPLFLDFRLAAAGAAGVAVGVARLAVSMSPLRPATSASVGTSLPCVCQHTLPCGSVAEVPVGHLQRAAQLGGVVGEAAQEARVALARDARTHGREERAAQPAVDGALDEREPARLQPRRLGASARVAGCGCLVDMVRNAPLP